MAVDLTVSIINTNNKDLLRVCLNSLFENTRRLSLKVYVVDNACTDGSAEMVETGFPQVKLIRNKKRLGFCANHNQVLRIGQGRYLCILNEDTEILPGAFDLMVEFMDNHPSAGAVGPMSLNVDGSFQASYSDFPTLWICLLQAAGVARYLLGPYHPSYPPEQSQEPRSVDWVGGVCLMVRREALKQVGLLDEDFFVYGEETDWCYRMHQAGWQIWYLPSAQIRHWWERAWSQQSPDSRVHRARTRVRLGRSHFVFLKKHYGHLQANVYRVLFAAVMFMRIIILSVQFVFVPDVRSTWGKQLQAYREGIWLQDWSVRTPSL